jgi:hypothetical protein
MSLRVTNGIPIIPRSTAPETGPPGVVNLDLSEVAFAGPVIPEPTTCQPPIASVIQQQTEWCWAACVEMGLTHYQLHQNQCAIVDKKREVAKTVSSPSNCCGHEPTFDLETCNISDIDDVWGKFDIEATLRGTPESTSESERVTFEMIQEEITASRPVEVAIRWNINRPGGHAVLIVGWTTIDGKPAVVVNDPLQPSERRLRLGQTGTILLSELVIASGYGEWEKTWTGIRKKNAGPQPGGNNG